MRLRILLGSAALVAALSAGLAAYADEGRRIVGRLAELHHSNTRALQEVRRILRPGETLADAAVWPDTIKRSTYEDEDTAPFRLEHAAHDTYHFASLPFQVDRYELSVPGARDRDIVQ